MIEVHERYRPFSHTPGSTCMIPGTPYVLRAFPTRIEIFEGLEKVEAIDLAITGPTGNFTVILDLEKGAVRVFGHAKEGYYEFCLFLNKEGFVELRLERGVALTYSYNSQKGILGRKKSIVFDLPQVVQKPQNPAERLSLGVSKKLDADLVWRRRSLVEMLPVFFRLGQYFTDEGEKEPSFLETREDFSHAIDSGFISLFAPAFEGKRFLGVNWPEEKKPLRAAERPFHIYRSLRNLLVRERPGEILLLPELLKDFICGRLVGAELESAKIGIEWTKGKLRRATIESKKDEQIAVVCPPWVREYRLRAGFKGKSQMCKNGEKFFFQTGHRYILDKFTK